MAENENRVSAVQEAPDSPQEPAALDTPPSDMPVYEPARPVRRVGTLTMGLALVVVGAALCVGLFFPNVDFLLLFKLSPLVLVALGCEVIFAASTAKGMRLKYDFLSMFVCFLLIVTALGAACVPVALQYAGPGRSAAEQRVEQELYEATYARLKGNGDIVNVTYDVHLGELRTPEDVTGAADLKAGDYVGVSAELKGTWATREEFVAACRPVIEAVRATGVRDPYISLYMRESRDTETPLYSLAVEGSYQADMTAEQLAQCVTERIYVDDAGYYMDAEELAGWQSEQSSAARDAELEALEAEWQARLDEAEAAAEQARAEAEERVAQAQGFLAIGHARVDDDHKGLAQRVQFPHNALFSFRVGRARHFCDGTVGGHDHAQRRVLSDDFARAQFRGLLKGNVVIEPGRAHHAGVLAFVQAQHAADQVAYAVYQAHFDGRLIAQGDFRRLVGHKFGLRRHDGASRAAHGQFIDCAFAAVFALHVREHEQLHKTLDKGGFSGAHGPDYADVYVAVAPKRDIAIQILVHAAPPAMRFALLNHMCKGDGVMRN